MKALNVFFIILFLFSATLQYNDPDPYIWIPIYLYGALLCLLAIRGRYYSALYLIGLVVYIAFAIFLLIDDDGVLAWANEHDAENIAQSMKATKPWIEQTREFFGLLILAAALVANMIFYSKSRRNSMQQYQSFWRGT